MNHLPAWKSLQSIEHLDFIINESETKPALILKYRNYTQASLDIKEMIEREWDMPSDELNCYLLDVMENKDVATKVSELAGVPNHFPQVLLFADGVAMYDESHDLINMKKIKIALKIINRTFKWMETRV